MKDILIVFGEGGHSDQMKRLMSLLFIDKKRCVSLVDKTGISSDIAIEEWTAFSLRNKHGVNPFMSLRNIIELIFIVCRIAQSNEIDTVISTGPGICIVPAIFFRLLGKYIVHIETWSRFSSRSFTGRIMYYLSNSFYVQNNSLLGLYPKAIYSGRL